MAESELSTAELIAPIPLDEIASALAPVVFAELATTFGFRYGIGNVTLEVVRHMTVGPEAAVATSRVVVAHLRLPVPAIIALKNACDGMLLQAAPAASEASN